MSSEIVPSDKTRLPQSQRRGRSRSRPARHAAHRVDPRGRRRTQLGRLAEELVVEVGDARAGVRLGFRQTGHRNSQGRLQRLRLGTAAVDHENAFPDRAAYGQLSSTPKCLAACRGTRMLSSLSGAGYRRHRR